LDKKFHCTYSLTGGDLKDLGGETNGALDAELLVLGTVDQVSGDCGIQGELKGHSTQYIVLLTLLEVLDVAAGQCDTDFVDLGTNGGTGGIVILFSFGDVTHFECGI
jgi:hypothetical protein